MDVEPTIEYANECAWSSRLVALGFRPDPETGTEFLVYGNEDSWHIEAYPCAQHTQVQFGVFGPGVRKFMGVPNTQAHDCAKRLVDFLADFPSVQFNERINELFAKVLMGARTVP